MNHKKFYPIEAFSSLATPETKYSLLPFRFNRLNSESIIAVQESGEYIILSNKELSKLVHKELSPTEQIYKDLKAKHFLFDDPNTSALDLLALKVRTKGAMLRQFTNLHLFVVTLRCDYSCPYCQVSRQTSDKSKYDMSEETALRGLDFVFKSPSEAIKIEFQGGEPLLAFDLIKFIVLEAEKINLIEKRDLQFVIATNMSYVDEEVLKFCEDHKIFLSTSLDGEQWLHDKNRPRAEKKGYELTTKAIQKTIDTLGPDSISALMTTTEDSFKDVKGLIDEYVKQGLKEVFLRPLSPYGFAVKKRLLNRYNTERWFEFYKEGLDYIIELNLQGINIIEQYTAIILEKILSPFPTGYIDLQSPSGAVTSAIVFNYDGDIYASDEGRMLAEMGDKTFCIGSLYQSSYEEVIGSEKLLNILEQTENSSVPKCSDCAYQKWCGSDPVYHYATQNDYVGHKEFSGYCTKNTLIFEHIINLLEHNSRASEILRSWVRT